MLLNSTKNVFVGKRSRVACKDCWQMPQGGIERGEKESDAAYRELYEESNISSEHVRFVSVMSRWLHYDIPPSVRRRPSRAKYTGQRQLWFLFDFLGNDSIIDVAQGGEFAAWKWTDWSSLIKEVVYFKRAIYVELVKTLLKDQK